LNQIQKSVTDLLERNAETKANRGEVRIFVTEVIQAFSEDAEVAHALETDVKTAADLILTVGGTVGGETTADQRVRSDAEAVDRSAKDEVTIELMVLAVRGIQTVVDVETDITVEEVANADTAAEHVVTAVRKESAAEHVEHKARAKGIAARSRSHRGLGFLARERGACKDAGRQRHRRKKSNE
jgi:hypothetical protein